MLVWAIANAELALFFNLVSRCNFKWIKAMHQQNQTTIPTMFIMIQPIQENSKYEEYVYKFRFKENWTVKNFKSYFYSVLPKVILTVPPFVLTSNYNIYTTLIYTPGYLGFTRSLFTATGDHRCWCCQCITVFSLWKSQNGNTIITQNSRVVVNLLIWSIV